jgi:fructose-1,6-bisphosphatase/inositol monophosphatase family enzyme
VASTDDVAALLRETAAEVVVPQFRNLAAPDVSEKSPGEVVTIADRRAEERLTAGLAAILPGSVVVGEEAAAADAAVVERLRGAGPVWIVDPIDGTANYAAGREPYAMMVALMRGGETVAAWIYEPMTGTMATGEAGAGAYVDGARVEPVRPGPEPARLRGVVPMTYLPAARRQRVRDGRSRLGEVLDGQHCAGREYLDLLTGRQQFAAFWRTLPWDHAPGALLVREAGGVVRRFDGTPYRPEVDGTGLLAAVSDDAWQAVEDALRLDR